MYDQRLALSHATPSPSQIMRSPRQNRKYIHYSIKGAVDVSVKSVKEILEARHKKEKPLHYCVYREHGVVQSYMYYQSPQSVHKEFKFDSLEATLATDCKYSPYVDSIMLMPRVPMHVPDSEIWASYDVRSAPSSRLSINQVTAVQPVSRTELKSSADYSEEMDAILSRPVTWVKLLPDGPMTNREFLALPIVNELFAIYENPNGYCLIAKPGCRRRASDYLPLEILKAELDDPFDRPV